MNYNDGLQFDDGRLDEQRRRYVEILQDPFFDYINLSRAQINNIWEFMLRSEIFRHFLPGQHLEIVDVQRVITERVTVIGLKQLIDDYFLIENAANELRDEEE